MTDKETNEITPEQEPLNTEEAQFITNVFEHVQATLRMQFPDYEVDGQLGNHQQHGPMMALTLKQPERTYTCGFFLSELVRQFQTNPHAVIWLNSFFFDMQDSSPEGKLLPNPPRNEDDAKEMFDKLIIPLCSLAVLEEFAPEQMIVDLGVHAEYGPVLEASFVHIKEGNNTCAIPLHYLLTLHLMNRDPAEPIIQALYQIKEVHDAAAIES